MAKAKRMYGCTECGATFPKWAGQCGECGAWNTLVETVVEGATPSGRFSHEGESSVRKTAIPRLAGIAMASAMKRGA